MNDELIGQFPLKVEIPLNDQFVKLVKPVVFIVSQIAFHGSAWWPIEVKIVSGQVEIVDNVVDEGPKVVWVVKPCVEELAGVGHQINDTDLGKKNIENIEILGFAWVKEAIRHKSRMPVVESDGEITESLSKPIASGEMFGILDDTIDKVTEAPNPSKL